jgi:malate dehydrogenase (oxaloacetate-decarboxylating)(NADP+)
MQHEGLSVEQARDRIYMVDVDGLLCHSRPGGLPSGPAGVFAKDQAPEKDLAALVSRINPSCLIGEF